MLTEQHKVFLKDFVKSKLKDDYDLFDVNANLDDEISYQENKNQLIEKIREFKDNFEESVKELKKEEKYNQMENTFIQNNYTIDLPKLISKPVIIGVVSDSNQGKSNFLYFLITELQRVYSFKLFTYGLKSSINDIKIHSVEELEKIKGSVIVIDEFFTLFDLEDRKNRKLIERCLRLIFHNNNVLILSGIPDNMKKYISAKLNMFIYGKCNLSDFINGSKVKEICLNYKGNELGSSVLGLEKDRFLIYDGNHYKIINVKYMEKYDSKKDNPLILQKIKKSPENCDKIVEKKISIKEYSPKIEDGVK